MAQPPAPKDLPGLYAALEHRAYTTYKSRLKACERIQARGRAWNTALIALAAATTVASVGLLVDDLMYGESGNTFLAACAILALAASLIVSSLDYPGRAVRMEANYKELQALSFVVEAARSTSGTPTMHEYNELDACYVDLVKHSENHSTADWNATGGTLGQRTTWPHALSLALTFLPYLTLVLPAWLFWQFGDWVVRGAG
ncbi:SLATT domain-containing protein [Nocardioides aurantiacus]|uniref:SLATT domain-containing protein n=1 Tax=Nocardioides aurantiacus TaxID=86796 RepID=UPI00403FC00E